MSKDREERIRQRAHEIWEGEGRPEGRHDEHWARATAEVDARATKGDKAAKPKRGGTGAASTGAASTGAASTGPAATPTARKAGAEDGTRAAAESLSAAAKGKRDKTGSATTPPGGSPGSASRGRTAAARRKDATA